MYLMTPVLLIVHKFSKEVTTTGRFSERTKGYITPSKSVEYGIHIFLWIFSDYLEINRDFIRSFGFLRILLQYFYGNFYRIFMGNLPLAC